MSQKFEPGELVNVRIDGVRYNGELAGDHLMYQFRDESELTFEVPAACAHVERVAPKEWPPRVGDIWANALGFEWLGRVNGELFGVDTGDGGLWTTIDRIHGPLRLVRRRDWTPDAPPAEPTPVEVDKRAELITALRTAADWIEQHTDLPVTGWRDHDGTVTYCARSVDELEQLADQLGTEVTTDDGGHLHAIVEVDGLRYRAFHVPAAVISKRVEPPADAVAGGETVEDAEVGPAGCGCGRGDVLPDGNCPACSLGTVTIEASS